MPIAPPAQSQAFDFCSIPSPRRLVAPFRYRVHLSRDYRIKRRRQGYDVGTVIECADAALYRAKAGGSYRVSSATIGPKIRVPALALA